MDKRKISLHNPKSKGFSKKLRNEAIKLEIFPWMKINYLGAKPQRY